MHKHHFRAALMALMTLFLASSIAWGQKVRPETLPQGFVIVVNDESQAANASAPIYMASGVNSWDPGDPDYVLSPRSDKRWQIVMEPGMLGEGTEFKFTLGSWARVELDAEGQEISNRQLPELDVSALAAGERPVIELSVPRFKSGDEGYVIAAEYRPIEATGTVKRLQVAGGEGLAAGKMRDLLVWLPPGYERSDDREYPVLYMLDGQNVFQDHAGIPGEWKLDETAQALVSAGLVEPMIIVGVPSYEGARYAEYAPPFAAAEADQRGRGDRFLDWLTGEVMPRVERAFRVDHAADRTGIGGAGLAGLFALYASHAEPETFGLVIAESPSLELVEGGGKRSLSSWIGERRADKKSAAPSRAFIGVGGAEMARGDTTGDAVAAARSLYTLISPRTDTSMYVVEQHARDELAWAERASAALMHLFPPKVGAADVEARRRMNMADPQDLEQGFRIVVTDESGTASEDRPIYFASNVFSNWNAGDPAMRLTREGGKTWSLTLPRPEADARVEFKFTLGSWDRVELAANGEQRDNRTLPMIDTTGLRDGETPELRFSVPRFDQPGQFDSRDMRDPDRPLEVTGDVRRLRVTGGAGRVADGFRRDLLVFLPEGYEQGASEGRRYPVLYLMDGQNVFERPPGLPGEWGADETATRLIAEGAIEPLIIVGVPNSGLFRADEYIPEGLGELQGVQPDGEAFVDWLVEEVMAAVESAYSVDDAPERTAIGGSSLGGIISLYAATTRPGAFGMALVESCSILSEEGDPLVAHIVKHFRELPRRVVLGMGTREVSFSEMDTARNEQYRDYVRRLADALVGAGMSEQSVTVVMGEGHHHNEVAWAERLGTGLRALYPAR
ncbi:MAG: hypothetical protein CMJ31_04740 [Phycisphaerae bacterium]|nr:hypothetical protein [Phycisphaerae bacterium]